MTFTQLIRQCTDNVGIHPKIAGYDLVVNGKVVTDISVEYGIVHLNTVDTKGKKK